MVLSPCPVAYNHLLLFTAVIMIPPYANLSLISLFTPYSKSTAFTQTFAVSKMPAFVHRMDTRRLRNSDMKRLVRILRHIPAPTDERKEMLYRKRTKEDIHNLPSRLRSSRLSFGSTNLCSTHKGLDHNLVNDIWQWLRHEFEGAIGKFLYPLIMSSRLTAEQEWKARQLEPVLQMWKLDFSLEASAPPDHQPISRGSHWAYQRDDCPACMMARIGSDEKVLFALFANMVGRFNTKSLNSIGGWDKTHSKRLRFVRYWIKTIRGGDITLAQAGELGLKMKLLRREWKDEQRAHLQSLDGTTIQGTPQTNTVRPSIDSLRPKTANEANHPNSQARSSTDKNRDRPHDLAFLSPRDSKLGPDRRSSNAKRLSPAAQLGFELPHMGERVSGSSHGQQDIHPLLREKPSVVPTPLNTKRTTTGSTHPVDTVKPLTSTQRPTPEHRPLSPPSPTPTIRPAPSTATYKRRDESVYIPNPSRQPPNPSLTTTSTFTTIASYTGGPSAVAHLYDPLDNPFYDDKTQEDGVERHRRLLRPWLYVDPVKEDAKALPEPDRMSMYSQFGNREFDGGRFDSVDEELKVEEREEWKREEWEREVGKGDEDEDGSDEDGEKEEEEGKERKGSNRQGSSWDDMHNGDF